jgi:hypothetical protein
MEAFSYTINAQNIYIKSIDGSNTSYGLIDVRKINFTANEMNVQLFDGSIYSWNLSSIANCQYSLNTSGIDELLNQVNSFNVRVFPNPTHDLLNIQYNLISDDKIIISLFDLRGNLVLEMNSGNKFKGENKEIIDISSLSSGQFICRISGQNQTISKNILKL